MQIEKKLWLVIAHVFKSILQANFLNLHYCVCNG